MVRRIPDLNPTAAPGQHSVFDTWPFHAFFTTRDPDTITANKTHRRHPIIEHVNAHPKNPGSRTCHPGASRPTPPGWYSR